ncbi:branched-chain amino acid transport system permease protein [Lipingzhangella halophila]|uniref:Branched-chain amino acid transport system permease protein n=1 Tax=Lipingzhangella halophila TaxID=1783352 RepID=A0A7W7W4S4_9ACTN|nr:branched-chain amino acid ABC transporter permease [Lipingzhangella halophila]MBB4933030.1 branched-chain amino acid transport system permease protein [Lipingzhangella halophila]
MASSQKSPATAAEPKAEEATRGTPKPRGLVARWNALPMLLRHILAACAAMGAVIVLTSVTGQGENTRIASVGFYMLAIAGLGILIGFSGQVSLGHGAFMFIGAYSTALFVLHVPMMPLWLNLILATAISCLAGLIIGVVCARLHGPYLAGATLALAVALPALANRFSEFLGGPNGLDFLMRGTPPALSDAIPNTSWQAWVVWLTVLIVLVFLANLSHGRLGRQMRAVRDDESAAALSGIRVARVKVTAFVISAGCGGLAGALQAYMLKTATPSTFTVALSLSLLAVLVLGGLGSLWGALWGAIAMVYVEEWGDELAHTLDLGTNVANNLPHVLYGVLLIALVLAWPSGVQGFLRQLGNALRPREHSGYGTPSVPPTHEGK